jgi:hypothetical protein
VGWASSNCVTIDFWPVSTAIKKAFIPFCKCIGSGLGQWLVFIPVFDIRVRVRVARNLCPVWMRISSSLLVSNKVRVRVRARDNEMREAVIAVSVTIG